MQIHYENIISKFESCADFKSRTIRCYGGICHVFFIEGMIDTTALSRFVIEKLRRAVSIDDAIASGEISFCDVEKLKCEEEAVNGILRGRAALISREGAYLFDVRKAEKRSVEQPSEESSVKASKDSFVEDMKVNVTLLRKKIASADLKVEKRTTGKQTHTAVSILYMANIANAGLVADVKRRLEEMDIDGIITPGVIEQHFSKHLYSFFPQVLVTERPDKIAASLLEGRCVLIADGLPIGYILPATLAQFMKTPEDYSGNFIFSSVVRLLRYFLLGIEVLLPGGYVALTTFHCEMLPGKLALSIADSREGVPFPVIFEVLTMLALFEVLIEAGLHMPQSSGQAVSIVGALVVGEAAISADLVSPAALIIVAVSAICSFAMPNQEFSNALRLWRVIITVAGAALGLFGVIAGGILMLAHLAGLESFGVPYLVPFAGGVKFRIKDSLLVVPDELNTMRPQELNVKNKRRRK